MDYRAKEKSHLEERASLLETGLLIPGCMGRNGPNEHRSRSDWYCVRERSALRYTVNFEYSISMIKVAKATATPILSDWWNFSCSCVVLDTSVKSCYVANIKIIKVVFF